MLHLSKFPLPRVHFELAKFKWVSFYFWKLNVGKVVFSFSESIQLKIIKCFIYDYLVILMHSILSSLSSPMDNLGCSKDYFLLFGRKWVDEVIGYFVLFTNRLSNIKSNAQCTAHRVGTTSQEPQKQIHFNPQQLISPPAVSRTQPNSFLRVVLLKQFFTM